MLNVFKVIVDAIDVFQIIIRTIIIIQTIRMIRTITIIIINIFIMIDVNFFRYRFGMNGF